MRDDFEHRIHNELEVEPHLENHLDEEGGLELREYISGGFLDLEKLGSQIYTESGGSTTLAGVTVDIESLEPKLARQVQDLKKQMQSVLDRTSKKILSITGSIILAGLLGTFTAVDYKKPAHFNDRNRAQREMLVNGITEEQRYSAYKAGLSELLARGVSPLGYGESKALDFPTGFIFNAGIWKEITLKDLTRHLMHNKTWSVVTEWTLGGCTLGCHKNMEHLAYQSINLQKASKINIITK